jgi:hypothetical protein
MDENKAKKLIESGYKVQACCGLCFHFREGNLHGLFGTCKLLSYEHLKHKETRELSVTRYGVCSRYSFNPDKKEQLHFYSSL